MTEDSFPVPYHVVTVDLDAGARVFARLLSDAEPLPDQRVICRLPAANGRAAGMVAEVV
jgi:hypothetical protein